jgi:hypothetical protein
MEYPSEKHLYVMKVLSLGNEDKSSVDLDQILERLDYKTTKQAFQFTLRTMIRHEWAIKLGMEKRRGRNRVLIGLTPLGVQHFESNKVAPTSIMEDFYDDDLQLELDI